MNASCPSAESMNFIVILTNSLDGGSALRKACRPTYRRKHRKTRTCIHGPSGICVHNSSVRAVHVTRS